MAVTSYPDFKLAAAALDKKAPIFYFSYKSSILRTYLVSPTTSIVLRYNNEAGDLTATQLHTDFPAAIKLGTAPTFSTPNLMA